MKTYEIVQGTPEWHRFRQNHIGASDSSVIMGYNPWRSIKDLWEEKTLGWEQPSNDAMARGQRLEVLAREKYELDYGIKMEPIVAEDEVVPYLSASFDGYNIKEKKGLEIKCGKSSHKLAQKGQIPPYYFCQLQHQMFIGGLQEIDYYSFDGNEGILIKQEIDNDFIKVMLVKYKEFWDNVLAFNPPEFYVTHTI